MVQIDVLIHGFPGRAVCHGGLGWSTIALLRGQGKTILLDTGAFGVRKPLRRQLLDRGVAPEDVTDVVLTHLHYDHSVNFTLFPGARVWVGSEELAWGLSQPPEFGPLPELYVRELSTHPRLHPLKDGDEVMPGLRAIASPGHTPGHLIYHLTSSEVPAIFTGDAAKNRAELLSRDVIDTDDRPSSVRSVQIIWDLWRAAPGTLLVPGHDLPMKLDAAGQPVYVAEREASIMTWFSESLAHPTFVDLCAGGGKLFTARIASSQP